MKHKVARQGGFGIFEDVLYKGEEVRIFSFPDEYTVEIHLNLSVRDLMFGNRDFIKVPMSSIKKTNK